MLKLWQLKEGRFHKYMKNPLQKSALLGQGPQLLFFQTTLSFFIFCCQPLPLPLWPSLCYFRVFLYFLGMTHLINNWLYIKPSYQDGHLRNLNYGSPMVFAEIITFQELWKQQIVIVDIIGPKEFPAPPLLINSPFIRQCLLFIIFLAPSYWHSAKISKSPLLRS